MEKTKKEKKQKKEKKEKQPKNNKKSGDKRVPPSYRPTSLPYFSYTGSYHFDKRDREAHNLILTSTNVPSICITDVVEPEEWLKVIECMSNNKSITSVTVTNVNLESRKISPTHLIRHGPPMLKEFIMKLDDKHTISMSNFIDLCSAIKESKTLERIGFVGLPNQRSIRELLSRFIEDAKNIRSFLLDNDCCEPYTFEALKSATNVTELSLHSISFEEEDKKYLEDIMKRLTKLELISCSFGSFDLLANAKNLTSLTLDCYSYHNNPYILAPSIISLKNQLQELSLGHKFPRLERVIADLLDDNNTLKKLAFTGNNIDEDACSVIMDALKFNTSVTHLSFVDEAIGSGSIGRFLQTNNSLKTLEIKQCLKIDDLTEISEALKVNTSLTELHIQRDKDTDSNQNNNVPFMLNQDSIMKLTEALKVNKALRVFSFDFEFYMHSFEHLLVALGSNPNLKHVCLSPKFYAVENARHNLDFWDRLSNIPIVLEKLEKPIIQLLQRNIGLKYLKIWTCYTAFMTTTADTNTPGVLAQMHKNQEIRQARINQAVSAMKMAVLRPNFVGAHLPLEIWRIIFSFFNAPEIDIDFSNVFSKIVDQFNKQ